MINRDHSHRSQVSLISSLIVLLFVVQDARSGSLFTVGVSGSHTTIQSAIDACPSNGCTIQLLDTLYKLPREIWIEGKQNLLLQRSEALRLAGIRPRLVSDTAKQFLRAGTTSNPTDPTRPAGWRQWPKTCKEGAGGVQDTTNPYSATGFQYNGLVVVVSSQDILIEGLALDGLAPSYFINTAVYDCRYDLLFGNVGLNLFQSARVTLRDSDIRNFFAALHIQNHNPDGAVPSPDLVGSGPFPSPSYSRYGTMGDHLVEDNLFVGNWWVAYDQMEWDLGSTFRFNRMYSNRNSTWASVPPNTERINMSGGFLYVKDVTLATHRIHNNTIWGSPIVMGHGNHKFGIQHLFYNNLVGGFQEVLQDPSLMYYPRSDRQVLRFYRYWVDHNTFESPYAAMDGFPTAASRYWSFTDTALCSQFSSPTPCTQLLDSAVPFYNVNQWLIPQWIIRKGGILTGSILGSSVQWLEPKAPETFPGGGEIDRFQEGATPIPVLDRSLLWATNIPLQSTDPAQATFLEPIWTDPVVTRSILGNASPVSGWSLNENLPDRGAVQRNKLQRSTWSLRSQLPVHPTSAYCFEIPLRTVANAPSIPSRLHRVDAWSMSGMVSGSPVVPPITPLRIRAFTDSVVVPESDLTVCLETPPPSDQALRFHVTLEAPSGSDTLRSETAYFLLNSPSARITTATQPNSSRVIPLRAAWTGKGLRLEGLEEGAVSMSLHALDGRRVLGFQGMSLRGHLDVPMDVAPRGTWILRVLQDGRSQSRVMPAMFP